MQPTNEVFRRIEDVGPVICERGHWSVVVKFSPTRSSFGKLIRIQIRWKPSA